MSNILEYFGVFAVAFLFGFCIGATYTYRSSIPDENLCSTMRKEKALSQVPANSAYKAIKILCEEDN